jgi:hypothetical protein
MKMSAMEMIVQIAGAPLVSALMTISNLKLAAGLQFDLSLQINIGNGSAKTVRLARGVVGKSLELGLLFSEELLNARMLLCRALH